ncbi:MAG: hypothetical protein U1D55_14445 [Phycisphaerae bacterium]
MSDEAGELRRICWTRVLPFTRLFSTFQRARDFKNLCFGLAAVICAYVAGRALDGAWTAAGAGVSRLPGGALRNEIEAYVGLSAPEFDRWRRQTVRQWTEFQATRGQLDDSAHREQLDHARSLVEARVQAGRKAIAGDAKRDAGARRQALHELELSADIIRMQLAGYDVSRMADDAFRAKAFERLAAADESVTKAGQAEDAAELARVAAQQRQLADGLKRTPRGPFIESLDFQSRCFAAAIRGVCAGRFGFSGGGVLNDQPAMAASLVSSGAGVLWMVTQRPWFTLVYGVALLVIFAYFGVAICRATAIRAARDEALAFNAVSQFVREKYPASVMAVAIPLLTFVGFAALLIVGGLVGAIPGIGPVLSGLTFGLALLLGAALVAIFIGMVFGSQLLWPTIAVEGSDAFDAIQRAFGYVFQRGWSLAFYAALLLAYGGVGFVAVRGLAMLLLKLTHSALSVGMGFFGAVSGARMDTFPQLSAMWHIPSWSDLSVLPTVSGPAFWGSFGNAPLSGVETLGMWLIAAWVFLVVAGVGAFVVSFYFAGATQMYLLLRHEVDGVDFEEVYYEEYEEEAPTATAADIAKGASLPIINAPPSA